MGEAEEKHLPGYSSLLPKCWLIWPIRLHTLTRDMSSECPCMQTGHVQHGSQWSVCQSCCWTGSGIYVCVIFGSYGQNVCRHVLQALTYTYKYTYIRTYIYIHIIHVCLWLCNRHNATSDRLTMLWPNQMPVEKNTFQIHACKIYISISTGTLSYWHHSSDRFWNCSGHKLIVIGSDASLIEQITWSSVVISAKRRGTPTRRNNLTDWRYPVNVLLLLLLPSYAVCTNKNYKVTGVTGTLLQRRIIKYLQRHNN